MTSEVEPEVRQCPDCTGAGNDGHGNNCYHCDGQGGVVPFYHTRASLTEQPPSGPFDGTTFETRAERNARQEAEQPPSDGLAGELARLDALATPGPWAAVGVSGLRVIGPGPHVDVARRDWFAQVSTDTFDEDAICALIVLLRNNLPAILAALSREQPPSDGLAGELVVWPGESLSDGGSVFGWDEPSNTAKWVKRSDYDRLYQQFDAKCRAVNELTALSRPDDATVERVARAIAADLARQDYMGPDDWQPAPDWNFTWPYIDQGEVDFREVAKAALAALRDPGAGA